MEEKAKGNVLTNAKRLMQRLDVLVFLLTIFLLGANWGFIEQYLFVYLKSIDAPTYLLGKLHCLNPVLTNVDWIEQ